MASDKSGRMRRPASAASDPRVDDSADGGGGGAKGRARVPRQAQAEVNPLDRITSFETTSRPAPGVPPIVPAERPEADAEDVPAALLVAPPPPAPVEQPPAPVEPVTYAPTEPPGPEAAPLVDSPAAAAALLDLGGMHRESTRESSEAAAERALEPLALLRPLHRPVVFRKARRPRVRRVTRVVRHIDTWSVFKVAFVFNLVVYIVCLTAGVLLWNVAYSTGTIDNIENFFEQFGWESFEFVGGEIFHNAWIAGLFVSVGLTGFAVLLATLFNLITDLVGGIRVSVLEEEVVAKTAGTRSTSKPRGAGFSFAQLVPQTDRDEPSSTPVDEAL